MAAEKQVDNLDFSKYPWDNIIIKCQSRDPSFIDSMRYARECIKSGSLDVQICGKRHTIEIMPKTAFENKLNGTDKGRTYLLWMY